MVQRRSGPKEGSAVNNWKKVTGKQHTAGAKKHKEVLPQTGEQYPFLSLHSKNCFIVNPIHSKFTLETKRFQRFNSLRCKKT